MWKNKFISLQITAIFTVLNKLQRCIFAIYLKKDYAEKEYFYEKNIHEYRFYYFKLINKLRNLVKKTSGENRKKWELLILQLEEIFEIIGALGNLRYRIHDHSTFEVCRIEFIALTKKLSTILRQLAKKEIPAKNLLTNIEGLENIFRQTLQVVLKDPMIFLFFIQNVNDLNTILVRESLSFPPSLE